MSIKELPAAAWATVFRWTGILTAISASVSVLASQAILSTLSHGLGGPGLAAAALMPVLLGGPITFWHLVRMQQLKLANEKLQVLASTDWLTACLNRRAFTHAVSSQLGTADNACVVSRGALLVIDADHFKIVNDVFGHDRGDEALQLMAEVIRSKVPDGALVCRMGGEEFGVFLEDATRETATLIGERIRRGINTATFAPDGMAHPLSVSIGAAVFEGSEIGFSELFRVADQHLYAAKQAGRNRAEIGVAQARPVQPRVPELRQVRTYLAGVR